MVPLICPPLCLHPCKTGPQNMGVCCRTERLQCEKTQQLYAGQEEWITGLERERKPRRAAVDSHINQQNLLSPSQITELSILNLNSFQILHCRFSLSNSVRFRGFTALHASPDLFCKNVGKKKPSSYHSHHRYWICCAWECSVTTGCHIPKRCWFQTE